MRVHGVAGVVLYANEPEALSGWYGRLLGLSFARAAGGRLEARLGAPDEGAPVIAIEEAPAPLADGARDAALVLQVADLDALLKRLELRGIEPDLVEPSGSGRRAWIRDPEGRKLGLHEAPAPAATREAAPEAAKAAEAPQPPAEVKKEAVVAPPAMVNAQEPAAAAEAGAGAEAKAGAKAEAGAEAGAKAEAGAEAGADAGTDADADAEAGAEAGAEADITKAPEEPERVGDPAPIIVGVRPEKLSSQFGGALRILGANFAADIQVRLGGAPCPARRLDAGMLEINVPPRAVGPCAIEVENPDGQRAASAVLVEVGPEIARLVPAEGPPRGGTAILVEGSGFKPGCMVSFFGAHAPEVEYQSATHLRFITPARHDGTPGSEGEGEAPAAPAPYRGEVRVTNPDGLSCAAPGGFSYRLPAPRIHGVSPADGYLGGGKRVTVAGEDFEAGCVARVGGRAATATRRTAQVVDVIIPPGERPGPVDVEIEGPDGQIARAAGAFTYELPPAPPKLIEVRPDRGFIAGGLTVHLHGDNFDEATVVRIAEVRVAARFVSRTELVIEAPPRAEPGVVAIELVDANGVVVRREDAFTYEARQAPRVSSLSPRNGPTGGGTRVIVEGEHFPPGATVRIGRQAPPRAVVRSATLLELITPPSREPGFVDLELGGPECGMVTVKNAFRYDATPPPVITSVAPNRGGVGGGTELSITGKNFGAGAIVLIGGKPASGVKVVDATTIEVKTPPGSDGQMVDVVVKSPDGKEAAARRAFQYDARYRG